MRLFLSLCLTLILALPAAARPLSEADQAALDKAVLDYMRATMAGSAEKVVATIPPRIVNVFAGAAGIEAKKVQKALVDQTAAVMEGTRIRDFVAKPGPYDANDATLADGSAVTWVVVPVQFRAEGGGKATFNDQPLLAILEGGQWYFSRVDGPQQQQVVALAYPFIAEAKLPAASSTPAQ